MTRLFATILFVLSAAVTANASQIGAIEGWRVYATEHSYPDMVERLNAAVKANKMGLVTRASATVGAKRDNITIPGNMVIGVYRNDFARRMLKASIAAGIEAPIRFYITEEPDGTSLLSYKTPTKVFSPYFDSADDDLKKVAEELDEIFEKIAEEAVQ